MGVSRSDVVTEARSWVGKVPEHGYDGPNPFSRDLGHPQEAWCGDFCSDIYKRVGLGLPSMQSGCSTGFAYCPDAWASAETHHARLNSWDALAGDLCLFDWNGDGTADHVEMVVGWNAGTLTTIGGNSHPDGGVNEHQWPCPAGAGNREILGVVDTGKFVDFGSAAAKHKPKRKYGHRLLLLKTANLRGPDILKVQRLLIHNGHTHLKPNSVYDEQTAIAVADFQKIHHIPINFCVDRKTARKMRIWFF